MSKKRQLTDDLPPEIEVKFAKYEHESVKKHSLDSDEEDSDQEKKGHYEILHDDDIEGQEDGISGNDGEIKITPFNMKEELEEGHFDTEGNFHWNKDNEIRDNWQDNIDWMKVEELSQNYKPKNSLDDSMDSFSQSPFDSIAVYKQILEYMKPGETVAKTLKRLGGNKSLSASERLKRKKAGLSVEDKGDATKVIELTELANRLLTKTGNMDIYQESYQYIKKLVESKPGPSSYDDALDMYADDFDEKEKKRIENKAVQNKTETQMQSTEESEEEDKKEECLMWEYKVEKDEEKVLGPHTTEQMQKYVEEGFFKGEVWVRKVGQSGPFYSSRRIDFQIYL